MSLRNRQTDLNLSSVVDDDGVAYLKTLLLQEVDLSELSALSEDQRRARLERVVGHLLTREGPLLHQPRAWPARTSRGRRGPRPRRAGAAAAGRDDHRDHGQRAQRDLRRARRAGSSCCRCGSARRSRSTRPSTASWPAVNRRVDESSPMVDARLPGGERVNVIVPPLAVDGPTITIRRFPRPYSVARLVELGRDRRGRRRCCSQGLVRARLNIVVSGGTGSGKTTMLNALSSFIPARRADRHHRGRGRAAAPAGPRDPPGGAARQRRGHR